jgi:hypothetical protein
MMVQINQGERFLFKLDSDIPPARLKGPVTVAVDPGKTNMAVVIGHPAGMIYCILQLSSPGRHNDSTTHCMEFKRFFRQFLAKTELHAVGIEAVISKRGLNYHHSAKVLHEVRSQLIDVFYADFGKKPEEINNWSWKSHVLPDGYRSQSEKGSTRWFRKAYALYGNSDVTDAIGIFRYMVRDSEKNFPIRCECPEAAPQGMQVSVLYKKPANIRTFDYNENYSIFANAAYFANRSIDPGVTCVSRDKLSTADIERYFVAKVEEVFLLVKKEYKQGTQRGIPVPDSVGDRGSSYT